MENMSKFKVLTVIVICTFLFVVAAIYTNTKDVTTSKLKENVKVENVENQENITKEESLVNDIIDKNKVMQDQIDFLNKRIDELSSKTSGSSELRCRIHGTLSANGIEELSQEDAVQNAKDNNNELVVLCSF